MNNEGIIKWEKVRIAGKAEYYVVHGLFKWGVSLAIVFCLLFPPAMYLISEGSFEGISLAKLYFNQMFVLIFGISVFLNLPLGFLLGFISWNIKEKEYQRYLAAGSDE